MTKHARSRKTPLPLLFLFLHPIFAVSALAQAPPPAAPDTSTLPADTVPLPPSATPAPAPPPKKRRGFQAPKVGVDFDSFVPSSGKTRGRFGSNWGGLGFGVGRLDRPSGTGRISFDFSTEYKKSGDHHAFAAPLGVSYRRAFSAGDVRNDSSFIPYYGLSADLVVVDLRSSEDDVHSGFRLTEGGSLLVGTTVGKSGFLEGKYTGVTKVKGFDLSGFKLTAGVRF